MSSYCLGGPTRSFSREAGSCSGGDSDGDDENDIPCDIPHEVVEGRDDSEVIPIGEVVGKGICSEGWIYGSCATNMIYGDESCNPASILTRKHLKELRDDCDIPDYLSMHAPASEVRADWDLPGMVCLYELPFRSGFRFPLPRLVRELCSRHVISPGQLTPTAWRVLMAIELFCEMCDIDFSIDEVLTAYALVELYKNSCRYRLSSRTRPSLIPKLGDLDKNWKKRYFFVRFDSLGLPPGCQVRRTWDSATGHGNKFASQHPEGVKQRVAEFLSYPQELREWDAILTRSNLTGSTLWKSVSPNLEGIPCSKAPALPKWAALQRSIEVLFSGTSLFANLPPAEIAFADCTMSAPSGMDNIERFRLTQATKLARLANKAAKGKEKDSTGLLLPPPVPTASSKKRTIGSDASGCKSQMINLSFAESACAYSQFGPLAGEVTKTLLPKDKTRFDDMGIATTGRSGLQHAFQSMQTLIYMTEKVEDLEVRLKAVSADKAKLRAEAKALSAVKVEADRLKAELNEQLALRKVDSEREKSLLLEVESLKSEIATLNDNMLMYELGGLIKMKAQMARDWENNLTHTWDLPKIYADEADLEKMKALDVDPPGDALEHAFRNMGTP